MVAYTSGSSQNIISNQTHKVMDKNITNEQLQNIINNVMHEGVSFYKAIYYIVEYLGCSMSVAISVYTGIAMGEAFVSNVK